jgi:peptidoglycan/LPS O-acetylase OafA/YrhL
VKIFDIAAKVPPSRVHGAVTAMLVMLIVVSVSLVTYRIIEVPARRALRRGLSIGLKTPNFAHGIGTG